MPSAALVHDHFTGPTGMGRVTERHAHWLLEAGWKLTLVGDNIPADLAAACEVVAAPRPSGLPALPEHLVWCSRAARALRGVRADIVHVHSPLLGSRADLMTSHFMSLPAHARGVRELAGGVPGAMRRVQAGATRRLDDAGYRRMRGRTFVSFVSEFLRDEYVRHYGEPRGGWILAPPAPDWSPPTNDERAAARRRWDVPADRICVGYLGGADPRKGWTHLEALADDPRLHLMGAGPGSERMSFAGRPGLGFVDVEGFLAACDVIVAPAAFDSAPVAVLQAVARDVPVVCTPTSGWAPELERSGAGVVWDGSEPFAAAVHRAAAGPREVRRAFTEDRSERHGRGAFLAAYEAVLAPRSPGR